MDGFSTTWVSITPRTADSGIDSVVAVATSWGARPTWKSSGAAADDLQPAVDGNYRRPSGGRPAADYDRDRPWGRSFYEQAMASRAQENSVYFASVNQAMRYQNSATSLIDPAGRRSATSPTATRTCSSPTST